MVGFAWGRREKAQFIALSLLTGRTKSLSFIGDDNEANGETLRKTMWWIDKSVEKFVFAKSSLLKAPIKVKTLLRFST